MRDDRIIVLNEQICTVMVLKGEGAVRERREYCKVSYCSPLGLRGRDALLWEIEPTARTGEVFERTLTGGFMRPDVWGTL